MKAMIIPIGNSRGIRIPKPLLKESGLEGTVELKVVKRGEIRITRSKSISKPKQPHYNEEYLMSLPVLAKEWDTPEEDKAWAHLQ